MSGKRLLKSIISTTVTAAMCINFFVMCPAQKSGMMTADALNTTIVNDTFWKDTSGNNIYSQGGGIFKFGDTYYWYGVHYNGAETYAQNPTKKVDDTSFKSVSCYSSKDLVNWKFENDVLTTGTKDFGWAYWVGRMGVAYCEKTKKYVLVTQYNESILFASCDTPTGNFKVERVQDQIENVVNAGTGDQTVFVDDDSQAYLICSNKGGRGHQYVSKLRESDFLNAEPAVEVAKGSGREGNCLFKYKGKYYFCASDLHGWNSSHTYYMVADKITGPYSQWAVMPGTDEDFSYVTQTGFFYTVKGSEQETVLYCGDRWSDFAGNGIGYNQWVPLSISGTTPKFNSLSEWSLNDDTGEWSVGASNNYIMNPTFEADRVSQTTLAGWKASGTGNSNRKGGHTGNWCTQQYDANAYKATLTQDVTLPNGNYTLKAWVKSTGGQNNSKIYVTGYGSSEKNYAIDKKLDNWTMITINDINVTNGKCQVGIYSDANAGNWVMADDFTLISNGVSTPVTPPVTDGAYIKSLNVSDSENAADWSVQKNVQVGDKVFGDRDFTFTNVPDSLKGAERIQTACDSKKITSDEAAFTAGEDITVYVGLDTRVTPLPSWLDNFTLTAQTLTDSGSPSVTYQVYKKAYNKGEKVALGAVAMSNAVNYTVMAKLSKDDTTTLPADEPVLTGDKYLRGDLDFDGKIGVYDMCLMKQGIMKGFDDLSKNIADLNSDSKADVIDAKILQDFLLGKDVQFAVEYYYTAAVAQTGRQMEYLDRGVVSVSSGTSAYVSWRSLADDPADSAFNVYRTTDGNITKLNSSPITNSTNFTDTAADLTKNNTYSVKMVTNGKEIKTDGDYTLPANSTAQCISVPIKAGGQIHFVWTGDFNGDGKYDFLVDRNADDHQKLEAYLNDGTYLWTVDMGVNSENKDNISPGASTIDVGMWDGATVYDIDCDGYADVLVRIADGVKMGDGITYTNSNSNAQAIAVIDGLTGSLKTTAPVPDDYISVGPLACMMEVGYLDGKTPSLVCWMKNRNSDKTFNSLSVAYHFENGNFVQQWKYDNKILFDDRAEYKNGYAEAHQIRVVDVDSDGKDEVLHMGYALNGDGTLRYHMDDVVHGDRWFAGAFDKTSNGGDMMGYGIQQENASGLLEYYYNASTGKILWKNQTTDGTTYDVGRGNVGDIDPDHSGFECFSFQGTWTNTGTKIYSEYEYPCIRLWWDGDLLSEQYNDTKFEKWNYKNKTTDRLLSPWKITDCQGSERGAPMFYGDILGDWREEVIMTSTDFSKLVIFTTTTPTDKKIYCLAQDPCYRNCMTGKGYYQSHMLDYYLGSGMADVPAPDISVINK